MPTISLCMIVKNEEKVLKRCLDSLTGLFEEIIIVDTGSADSTKQIAKAYTDKVYDFAWTGSFSDARNFAFSKCSCDYIYSADADEVLDRDNHQKFLNLKKALDTVGDIDIVQMKYGNQLQYSTIYNYDEELRPKLYKRLRPFIWENDIHEAVRLDPVIFDSDIVITHMPEGEHTGRDIAAFEKIFASAAKSDDPCRELALKLNKKLHNLYAKELFVSGRDEDFLRACECFCITAEDVNRSSEEQLEAFCVCARACRLMGDEPGFFKYALRAIALEGCSEICYEIGSYFYDKGQKKEAAMWLYNAINSCSPILSIKYSGELSQSLYDKC